jgi:uncharacterized protein (UPF0303 family)
MSEPHETAGELLARIAEQERRLVVTSFSHEEALRLGMILAELARGRGHTVAVDVTRGEQQVFHAGLTGSSADNDFWIARKIRTTKRFGRSSLAMRLESERRPGGFDGLDQAAHALSGGCVPIRLADGALVGTATVSGLPDTEDHELVIEALEQFLAE